MFQNKFFKFENIFWNIYFKINFCISDLKIHFSDSKYKKELYSWMF